MEYYIEYLREILDRIGERIGEMTASERDRRTLAVGAAVLCVIVLYIIFQFFSSQMDKLERRAEDLERDLARVQALRNEYIESKREINEIAQKIKKEDEALISVVESILVRERINRGNFSIKDINVRSSSEELYNQTSVEVDIKKMPLNDLINVLYRIQTRSTFLKISDLRMSSRFDSPDLLDVSFRVSTFELKRVI